MAAASNLGATNLRRRRRGDPMRAFDALPPPLRAWIAQAALPWSPQSCLRLWRQARAEGATPDAAIARLDRAERLTLSRDSLSPTTAMSHCLEGKDLR